VKQTIVKKENHMLENHKAIWKGKSKIWNLHWSSSIYVSRNQRCALMGKKKLYDNVNNSFIDKKWFTFTCRNWCGKYISWDDTITSNQKHKRPFCMTNCYMFNIGTSRCVHINLILHDFVMLLGGIQHNKVIEWCSHED
jgi:hypothetical protein